MTSAAEEELEGAIWMALKVYRVTCSEPMMLVESIRLAAQAYAAGDSDALTQARRVVLHEATRPKRRPRPALAEGPASPPAPELSPPGSTARPVGGATLSTGHSVPVAGKDTVKSHPQATQALLRKINGRFAALGVKDRDAKLGHLQQMFGPGIHSSKDLSYTQAAQALQELTQ